MQGQFADAVFDALTERDVDPTALVSALTTLAEGRHLLAWSPDAALEEVWEAAGADGGLGPESFLVAVENFDANKIDPHVQPRVPGRGPQAGGARRRTHGGGSGR